MLVSVEFAIGHVVAFLPAVKTIAMQMIIAHSSFENIAFRKHMLSVTVFEVIFPRALKHIAIRV